ncbi:MAG: serine hydrolase domain-containing protein [bacterium]
MSAVVAEGNTEAFYAWAVDEIRTKNKGNAALVIIEDSEVKQQFFAGSDDPVDKNTLFPTASLSKWITALGVMSLVEHHAVDLDAPVARYLTRWLLPDTGFNNDEVTTRRLLSHTAGLTDALGFGDYTSDEVLPTVEEALQNPRASGGRKVEIAVGMAPGTQFQYSGGGYLILQLLVEEISGVPFSAYMQSSVLEPAQMRRSSYEYLEQLANVSASFNPDGSVAPTFQYASPAATGFSSSAADLSQLAQKILGGSNFLSGASLKAMREPHGFVMGAGIWGLGTILYAPTPDGDYVFGHDGANDPAINTTVRLNPDTSDGIVVLISGHPSLASDIGAEWVLWQTGYPDVLSTDSAIRSAVLPIISGSLLVIFFVFWLARRQA